MNTTPKYAFTQEALSKLLADAIGLSIEYQQKHGKDQPAAQVAAIAECLEGLDADLLLREENVIAGDNGIYHLVTAKMQKIGEVGVDTGQLMLVDPSYIDKQWEQEEYKDIRVFEHTHTKDRLQYKVDFDKFSTIIPRYGKNMNQLLDTGDWQQIEVPEATPERNFSYYAVCHAQGKNDGLYAQMNYKKGHAGVAVAFHTGIGDGLYDVYAEIVDCGKRWGTRVKKVHIEFLSEEEVSELKKMK